MENSKTTKFKTLYEFLQLNNQKIVCLITAIFIVTICSKCSPLYPLNDWVDSNCFFTIGKSIFKGYVPYRDLIDHKGPLLFFIHAFASLISYKSFFGVYLFEIIASFVFLYLSNKIIELFCGKNAFYIIPFLAFAVYRSKAFCHGDSAEELCFPFLIYTLYIALKNVRLKTIISNLEFFLIGIFASCVFWTKFTLCGIYLGWYIPFAIDLIIHKKYHILINSIIYIVLGLIAGTIPWIIYFGANHSIKYWLGVYIYNNLFDYTVTKSSTNSNFIKSLIHSLYDGFCSVFRYYRLGMLLLGIGGVYCYLRKWYKEFLYTAFMLFTTFFFAYAGGVTLTYYALIISPFVCLGLIPIFSIISAENEKNHILSKKTLFIYILIIVYTYICAPNKYMMKYIKDELPQYQFAKIISEKENATLLNYGFQDGGFYTTTGIIPNCKYFCFIGVRTEELYETQNRYITEGLCDFIVTRDNQLDNIDINHLYKQIAVSDDFYYEEDYHKYYLYKLK